MAKIYDDKINKHTDWGGDSSTKNLPVSGNRVQEFIKETLDNKAGVFYLDKDFNQVLVFADLESQEKYLENPDQNQDLILGQFEAPFQFEASISLISKQDNTILSSQKDNELIYKFDIKNKAGASTLEPILATYTFNNSRGTNKINKRYNAGEEVHFNIDKYLTEGVNRITIAIQGDTSKARTSINVQYNLINIVLDSLYENLPFDPNDTGNKLIYTYIAKGSGVKQANFYLDYNKVEEIEGDIIYQAGTVNKQRLIDLSNLSRGKHTLQVVLSTVINEETIYSNSLVYEFFLKGADNNKIGVQYNQPDFKLLTSNADIEFPEEVQFSPFSITYGINNNRGINNNIEISIGDNIVSRLQSLKSLITTELKSNIYGKTFIKIKTDFDERIIPINIIQSSLNIVEIKDSLDYKVDYFGKSNSDIDKDIWGYNGRNVLFEDITWTDKSGWTKDGLKLSGKCAARFPFNPFSHKDLYKQGNTLEFTFQIKNLKHTELMFMGNFKLPEYSGVLVTGNKIILKNSSGVSVETNYKEGEEIKVSLVVTKAIGSDYPRLMILYINGVMTSAIPYNEQDKFNPQENFSIFSYEDEADLYVKNVRFYTRDLTSAEILSNYIYDIEDQDKLIDTYIANDILDNLGNFDMDKLLSRVPVMIITGDVPTLLAAKDKKTQIYADVEFKNLQNPELSFNTVNTAIKLQGTSSLGYPRKNFRFQNAKSDFVYDAFGNEIEDKLLPLRENSQRVKLFTLKADYAESSCTHNTGIATLWNKALYDVELDGKKVCRTEPQIKALENDFNLDVRTAIDGYAIVMFYKETENSPLIFMGQYLINNDKKSESVFGFLDIPGYDNQYTECWEQLNNTHPIGLFSTMDNWDEDVFEAFEGRYPEDNEDTSNLKLLAQWLYSTKQGEAKGGKTLSISPEVMEYEGDALVEDTEENRKLKFKLEKYDHFDLANVAAYYCYTQRFGAVDQMVKNCMLTSYGKGAKGSFRKWGFINYDNDTVLGVRNDGRLVYDYTIDRQTIDPSFAQKTYAYMGHDSVLWNNLEADEEFMDLVRRMDSALYTSGLTYSNVIKIFNEELMSKWSEVIYNKNQEFKYFEPYYEQGVDNLFMLQGNREQHRKWWIANRFNLLDAKNVVGPYTSKVIEFKVAGDQKAFTITAGKDFYYGYGINNDIIESRVQLKDGEIKEFKVPRVLAIGDPVRIYGATSIKGLDLSQFKTSLAQINLANAYDIEIGTSLEYLNLGGDTTLQNISLTQLSGINNLSKLRTLNIQGFQNIKNLDLINNKQLRSLKAFYSGLVSVQFPIGSEINLLELPDTLRSFKLEDCSTITKENIKFQNNSFYKLKSLELLNCSNLNKDYNLIKDWYVNKEYNDEDSVLTITNFKWIVDNDDLNTIVSMLKLMGDKSTGIIEFKKPNTIEEYNLITEELGQEYLDKNNFIYIKLTNILAVTNVPKEVKVLDILSPKLYDFSNDREVLYNIEGTYGCHVNNDGKIVIDYHEVAQIVYFTIVNTAFNFKQEISYNHIWGGVNTNIEQSTEVEVNKEYIGILQSDHSKAELITTRKITEVSLINISKDDYIVDIISDTKYKLKYVGDIDKYKNTKVEVKYDIYYNSNIVESTYERKDITIVSILYLSTNTNLINIVKSQGVILKDDTRISIEDIQEIQDKVKNISLHDNSITFVNEKPEDLIYDLSIFEKTKVVYYKSSKLLTYNPSERVKLILSTNQESVLDVDTPDVYGTPVFKNNINYKLDVIVEEGQNLQINGILCDFKIQGKNGYQTSFNINVKTTVPNLAFFKENLKIEATIKGFKCEGYSYEELSVLLDFFRDKGIKDKKILLEINRYTYQTNLLPIDINNYNVLIDVPEQYKHITSNDKCVCIDLTNYELTKLLDNSSSYNYFANIPILYINGYIKYIGSELFSSKRTDYNLHLGYIRQEIPLRILVLDTSNPDTEYFFKSENIIKYYQAALYPSNANNPLKILLGSDHSVITNIYKEIQEYNKVNNILKYPHIIYGGILTNTEGVTNNDYPLESYRGIKDTSLGPILNILNLNKDQITEREEIDKAFQIKFPLENDLNRYRFTLNINNYLRGIEQYEYIIPYLYTLYSIFLNYNDNSIKDDIVKILKYDKPVRYIGIPLYFKSYLNKKTNFITNNETAAIYNTGTINVEPIIHYSNLEDTVLKFQLCNKDDVNYSITHMTSFLNAVKIEQEDKSLIPFINQDKVIDTIKLNIISQKIIQLKLKENTFPVKAKHMYYYHTDGLEFNYYNFGEGMFLLKGGTLQYVMNKSYIDKNKRPVISFYNKDILDSETDIFLYSDGALSTCSLLSRDNNLFKEGDVINIYVSEKTNIETFKVSHSFKGVTINIFPTLKYEDHEKFEE